MSLYGDNKSILLGSLNFIIASGLCASLGVLLIFQIKAYELLVSYNFSLHFFRFDLFATILILLILISIVLNILSSVIMMSGIYSHLIASNAMLYSIGSLLWLVLYISTDFLFINIAVLPVVLLILTLIILLTLQLIGLKSKIVFGLITAFVLFLPIVVGFVSKI